MKHLYSKALGTLVTCSILASCSFSFNIKLNTDSSISNSSITNSNNSNSTFDSTSSSNSSTNDESDTLTIFSINDFHGKIKQTSQYNGMLALQGAIFNNPNYTSSSPILSAGDMWQGSYQSGHDKGKSTTNLMNDFTFSAMVLGNHEFDWGFDKIEENLTEADFPFLCANLIDTTTKSRPSSINDHIVLNIDGYKLGVVGAIGSELESSIKTSALGNHEFSNDISLIRTAVNSCKSEGANATILLLHDDVDSTFTNSIQSSGLDILGIFGGHSHQFQLETTSGIIPYVQGGSDSRGYSYITIDKSTNKLANINYVQIDSSMANLATLDLQKAVNDLLDSISTAPIGKIKGTWTKAATANFVLQAMFYTTQASYPTRNYTTDNLIAVHNMSGIRGTFPSSSSTMDITIEHVQTVSPFDNIVQVLPTRSVSGKTAQTTGSNAYNYSYPDSSSWTTAKTMDIVTIDYLVSDKYSSAFSPTKPTDAETLYDAQGNDYIIYDVVADYIKDICSDGTVINATDYR